MEESGWCSLIYHMGVGATQAVWLTIHQNYIFLLWPAWFLSQITLCSVNHINTRRRARLGRQLGNWEAAQIGATSVLMWIFIENLNYAKLHKSANNNCSHLRFIIFPGDSEATFPPGSELWFLQHSPVNSLQSPLLALAQWTVSSRVRNN